MGGGGGCPASVFTERQRHIWRTSSGFDAGGCSLWPLAVPERIVALGAGVKETDVTYHPKRVNPYVEIVVKKGEAVVGYTLINICGDNNLIEESQTLIKKDSNSITADQAFGIMDDIIAGKDSQTEVKTKGNNTSYSMEHEYAYPGLVGLQIDVVRNGNSTAQSQLKFIAKEKPHVVEPVCDFTFCAVGTTTSHMQGSVQYEEEHMVLFCAPASRGMSTARRGEVCTTGCASG